MDPLTPSSANLLAELEDPTENSFNPYLTPALLEVDSRKAKSRRVSSTLADDYMGPLTEDYTSIISKIPSRYEASETQDYTKAFEFIINNNAKVWE